jgi:hypothetical protein
MGIEGDSMLSPTLINCNFAKPTKGLRFHPIWTNYPASAQGITAAIFIVAFKMDGGTLSAGRVTAEWDQAADMVGSGGAILRR